jgi:hypothetical protein
MDINVHYEKNNNYNESESTAHIIMDKTDTSTQLYTNKQTPDGIFISYNSYIIVTAKITDNVGQNVKYGTVQFYNNNQPIGKPVLVNADGTATIKYSPKKRGILSAIYLDNEYFNKSTSNTKIYKMVNIDTDTVITIKNDNQSYTDAPQFIEKNLPVTLYAEVKQLQTKYHKETKTETNELIPVTNGVVTFYSLVNLNGESRKIGTASVNNDGIATLNYAPTQDYLTDPNDPNKSISTEYIEAVYNNNSEFKYYNPSYGFSHITVIQNAQPYISIDPLYGYGDDDFKLTYKILDTNKNIITDKGILKIYVKNSTQTFLYTTIDSSATDKIWNSSININLKDDIYPLGKYTAYIVYNGTAYSGVESNYVDFTTLKKNINITPIINIKKYDSVEFGKPYRLQANIDQKDLIGETLFFCINNNSIIKSSKIENDGTATFDFYGSPGDYIFYAKVDMKQISNKNADYTFNESKSSISTFSIYSNVKLNLNPISSPSDRLSWRGKITPLVTVENAYGSGILHLKVGNYEDSTTDTSLSFECKNLEPGSYKVKAWTDGNNFGKGQPSTISTTINISKQTPLLVGWAEARQTADWGNAPLWLHLEDLYHEGFDFENGGGEFCFELHKSGKTKYIKYYNNKRPQLYDGNNNPLNSDYSGRITYEDNYARLPVNLNAGNYYINYYFKNSKYYEDVSITHNNTLIRIKRKTCLLIKNYPTKTATQGDDSIRVQLSTLLQWEAVDVNYQYGIDNANIKIKLVLSGKETIYDLTTRDGGYAELPITYSHKDGRIKTYITYNGDEKYESCEWKDETGFLR